MAAAPLFIDADEASNMQRSVQEITDILFRLTDIRFDGSIAEHARALGFAEPEIDFLESFAGIDTHPCVIARPDCIVRDGLLKVLEFNVGGNVGGFVSTDLHGPLLSKYYKEAGFERPAGFHPVVADLVDLYRRLSRMDRPRVLLLEWRDRVGIDTTEHTVEMLRDLIVGQGLDCVVGDPRDAVFDGQSCYFEGNRIDLAHRFFSWNLQDLEPGGRLPAEWISLVRSQALPFVGWRTSKLWGSKGNLALLSEMLEFPEFTSYHAAIRRSIPWTRMLRDESVTASGQQQNLLDRVRAGQFELVLKKASGTDDGRDVVIGREVSEYEWAQTIRDAAGLDWIVQEYVEPQAANFPVVDVERMTIDFPRLHFVVSPFVIDGKCNGGAWVRAQPSSGPTHIQFGNVLTTCVATR